MLKNCPGTHAALTKSQLVSGPLQTMQTSSDIFSPFSILSLSLSLSISFLLQFFYSQSLSLSLSYFLFLFLSISFVNYLVCKHSAASGNRTSNYPFTHKSKKNYDLFGRFQFVHIEAYFYYSPWSRRRKQILEECSDAMLK